MKSMFSLSIAVAAMLAGSCAATDSILDSMLNAVLVGRQDTTYQWEGCYSDPGSMEFNSTSIYQSKKTCHDVCAPMNMSVEATTDKTSCWCGNSLPSNASLVDISKCNAPCVGYPAESCRFTPALVVGAPF
jgi:WSC domain